MEVFQGSLHTEQKIGDWREALLIEMNVIHSEEYHKTVARRYLVGSSSAPYRNSKYTTYMLVVDAKLQHRLIDQLFLMPKCVRLTKGSEKFYELLTKILRALPERSRDELEKIKGGNFMKLGTVNVRDFQKRKRVE